MSENQPGPEVEAQSPNKWIVAVKIGNRPEFFAFPTEQERTDFISEIPGGVEYGTAFDDGGPTLKFEFSQT